MKPITLAFLKSLGACQGQVDLFAATYGEEVIPTLAICEAAATIFDLDWLGRKYFKEAYEAAKAPHREAYEAATAPHWEAYKAAKAPLREAYKAAKAPLRKAYEAAKAPHREAYLEAMAPHAQALELAQARVFFTLWSQQ